MSKSQNKIKITKEGEKEEISVVKNIEEIIEEVVVEEDDGEDDGEYDGKDNGEEDGEDDGEDDCEDDGEDDDDEVNYGEEDQENQIDLSKNEIYRGICTLFEDEDGNNILEYISLLHTELIGINKSLENLKLIRKDINRIAEAAETFFLKDKKGEKHDSDSKKKESSSSKPRKEKS